MTSCKDFFYFFFQFKDMENKKCLAVLYLLDIVSWCKPQDFAKEVELPIQGILDVFCFAEPMLLPCTAVHFSPAQTLTTGVPN